MTQMLPATAKEMAAKIGLPWRPDLLTDQSPTGAAYQQRLGRAYFNEGLQKTGNLRDALRYYHGGPNPSLWGPKTNAYADAVLSRMGGM
jgi:soluble lytic murein transglycosylase-like protein